MRKLLYLFVPALLLIAGCSSKEDQLVGKWRGKIEMGGMVKEAMGPMSGIANMLSPMLDLRPNRTFVLSVGPAPIEGSWRLEDKTLILTPKTMMGMSAESVREKASKELERAKKESPFPIPFSMGSGSSGPLVEMKAVLNDNDSLTLDPGSGTILAGFGKMVFKKV